MKGYGWSDAPMVSPSEPQEGGLPRWESIAVEAVGHVIEFWGFKHNQGRVWALLYLRATAMSATQLEEELGLSKGGVSMLVRDLERWGVVHRVRQPGAGAWHYRSETDLVRMVSRVIEERAGLPLSHPGGAGRGASRCRGSPGSGSGPPPAPGADECSGASSRACVESLPPDGAPGRAFHAGHLPGPRGGASGARLRRGAFVSLDSSASPVIRSPDFLTAGPCCFHQT